MPAAARSKGLGIGNETRSPASLAGTARVLARSAVSAISPNASRRAKAGVGRNAGRAKARPSTLENSRFVTGSGETTLMGPASLLEVKTKAMAAMASFISIQLQNWPPPPNRPPNPKRKGRTIFARAPPCLLRTIPNRKCATRIPTLAASAVASFQSDTVRPETLPGRALLGQPLLTAIAIVPHR